MDVVCGNCNTKIKIPDEKIKKIPPGQTFAISCPKCKNKISVENKPATASEKPAAKPAPAPPPKPDKPDPPPKADKSPPHPEQPAGEESSGSENGDDGFSGNPFEFLEEGTKTALICEGDAGFRAKIKAALSAMKYQSLESSTHRDALKQMRFHDFDVVILNERFGTRDPDMNHVLKHLEQLPMATRRNMFIALLSERFRTVDNMIAFNKSVNMVVNVKDINDIEKIISRGVKENDAFFRVYKESLKKLKG
jgi:hypothetical protein